MIAARTYCLDANVLIQAWQKYYAPRICPSYWDMLNTLGQEGRLFIPRKVIDEIEKTEDDLKAWVRQCQIPVYEEDGQVAQCLTQIYAANPLHRFLVDNIRQRSVADPWVIAHAMKTGACVVTKEEFSPLPPSSTRIKIPHVCQNMGIPFMSDFDFVADAGITFSCIRA